MPGQGQPLTDLLTQVKKGNTTRARCTTTLMGLVRQVLAIKSDPAAITEWAGKMNASQIEEFANAIEGLAGAGATGGGSTKGAVGGGKTGG